MKQDPGYLAASVHPDFWPAVDAMAYAVHRDQVFVAACSELRAILSPMDKLQRAKVVGTTVAGWGLVLIALAAWIDHGGLAIFAMTIFALGAVLRDEVRHDIEDRLDQWNQRWMDTARLARRAAAAGIVS